MIIGSLEMILLIAALLLFLSVVASKVSDRFGVPVLLLFMTIGMLAGSEGLGGIDFNDPRLTQSLGAVALVFILFSGGFDTDWKDIRDVLWRGFSLATFGVLITAILAGTFAAFVLRLSWIEGLLIGAIVSSTDAAAVFNILKSKNVSLRGKLHPLLELESGSNDPMAVFLTVGLIALVKSPGLPISHLFPLFVVDMGIGTACGFIFGKVLVYVTNRIRLTYEGLYPVLIIALVLLTYAITMLLKGNGFLAVYLVGLAMGNANLIHKKMLRKFTDGIAWLMQIVMFLTLGLLVFPSRILAIMIPGILISVFLMFVARPLAVFLSLSFAKMDVRDKVMVSWVGLRGAVPIILATFPLLAGIPGAETIFDVVFFIVLTSVLFQGTSLPAVSRWLKVNTPMKVKKVYPIEFEYTGEINASLEDVIVPYDAGVVGQPLFKIGISADCLVVLISREDKFFIPNGSTVIQGGDVLLVLANEQSLKELNAVITRSLVG